MINIEDNDLPITVAQKIISGTRPYTPTPIEKAFFVEETVDMFSVAEIKEIAEYLLCYCKHNNE